MTERPLTREEMEIVMKAGRKVGLSFNDALAYAQQQGLVCRYEADGPYRRKPTPAERSILQAVLREIGAEGKLDSFRPGQVDQLLGQLDDLKTVAQTCIRTLENEQAEQNPRAVSQKQIQDAANNPGAQVTLNGKNTVTERPIDRLQMQQALDRAEKYRRQGRPCTFEQALAEVRGS